MIEPHLIERQVSYAAKIAEILGRGAVVGRTVSTSDQLEALIEDRTRGADLFFLPHMTLCDPEGVARLGVNSANMLGGAVHHSHERTKTIMHRLVAGASHAPSGWCAPFADATRQFSLPGYAAFTPGDVMGAADAVLAAHGSARLKLGTGSGGEGQFIIADRADARKAVDFMIDSGAMQHGCVIEPDLVAAQVYQVDMTTIAGQTFSCAGRVKMDVSVPTWPKDIEYETTVVRGGLADLSHLFRQIGQPDVLQAVNLAMETERHVRRHLPHILKSRIGYQLIDGTDHRGRRHIGVLEQSWRRGASTGGTLLAAQRLVDRPDLTWVRVKSRADHEEANSNGGWTLAPSFPGTPRVHIVEQG